jgi:hypothetical protein
MHGAEGRESAGERSVEDTAYVDRPAQSEIM